MRQLLPSSMALLWGLQFAFLTPALALMLVDLFGATPADVGWVLALYNGGGFLASLIIPALADRKRDYLRPMLLCGLLALALPGVLALTSSLPLAVVALLVLGGPAGVGMSLFFAHLKQSGAGPQEVVTMRAVVSFAWVAGPPLATVIIGSFGSQSILLALAAVALLNLVTTGIAFRRNRTLPGSSAGPSGGADDGPLASRLAVIGVVIAFTILQATDSSAVTIMALFVDQKMDGQLIWAGIALGVAAALEIPALLAIGRLSRSIPEKRLIASGCIAGVLYYTGMTFAVDPIALLSLQILHAWFFGVIAGVGLTLFQKVIPRPGLAAGLFTNTRRIGAIASGPIIAFGSMTALGYQGVFGICAVLTLAAMVVIELTSRGSKAPAAKEQIPAASQS
ncbi:MFS transporter [Paenarthrobacter ureafaciens]|uniref:MFS transporter n=1 Tax=Paenarthrobacter ureafaciens TaxID=37931 RepID=UPI002263DF2C|nr:MFS transporter [Paenarthrobacter ureafaciens]MCX8454298.1 MFS transporter [Paenarthrobacter ureafaciens]MCY0972504.1 MFS transporter [Paenarthrobacter ureafaciens]